MWVGMSESHKVQSHMTWWHDDFLTFKRRFPNHSITNFFRITQFFLFRKLPPWSDPPITKWPNQQITQFFRQSLNHTFFSSVVFHKCVYLFDEPKTLVISTNGRNLATIEGLISHIRSKWHKMTQMEGLFSWPSRCRGCSHKTRTEWNTTLAGCWKTLSTLGDAGGHQ